MVDEPDQINSVQEIRDFHEIACLKVPPGWVAEPPTGAGLGTAFSRSFVHVDQGDAKLSLFHNGRELSGALGAPFRNLLFRPPEIIVDLPRAIIDGQSVIELTLSLGNMGDNQFFNTHKGIDGAAFVLQKLETVTLNERRILHCQGFFRDKWEKPVRYLESILFDGTPDLPTLRVHEIVLQSKTSESLMARRQDFIDAVWSIKWRGA